MSEWKELTLDNLPPINAELKPTEQYDIEYCSRATNVWYETNHSKWWMIIRDIRGWDAGDIPVRYRYREPEPKSPSNEELAIEYADNLYSVGFSEDDCNTLCNWFWDAVIKAFVAGRESADIPPKEIK